MIHRSLEIMNNGEMSTIILGVLLDAIKIPVTIKFGEQYGTELSDKMEKPKSEHDVVFFYNFCHSGYMRSVRTKANVFALRA